MFASDYPHHDAVYPGAVKHIAAAGGGGPMNRAAARNYGDFFNTYQFTGLFESMARRELRRNPTILD